MSVDRRIVPTVMLAGVLAGCGGGGSDSGDENQARISKENYIVAANSFEILEQPVALSNFFISTLHQLSVTNGKLTGDCLFDSNGTGSYTAELKDKSLQIAFIKCDVEGLGDISGMATATFNSLVKSDPYLEFDGDINIDDLRHTSDEGPYTASYSAHISQKITAPHKVNFSMALTGDESIIYNDVPFYFRKSEIRKTLDYSLGDYVTTVSANLSLPSAFKGELLLRTTTPLSGHIRQYPAKGRYEVQGSHGDYVAVNASHSSHLANAEVHVAEAQERVEITWDTVMSGAAIAFPSRRGMSTGEFDIYGSEITRKSFPEQSPAVVKSSEHPLRPIQTLLVMPTPEPEDLVNAELRNNYESAVVPSDKYTITANGPWVTAWVIDDLAVDRDFTLQLKDRDDRYYAEFQFDTKQAFEIQVTKDQVILSDVPFTLDPIKVTDETKSFSINWTQLSGDKDIKVKSINSTQATVEPVEMTPGEIYEFQAEITDPFDRVTKTRVNLSVDDPVKGNSYLSVKTDSAYFTSPNRNELFIVKAGGNITDTEIEVRNANNGSNNNAFSLHATGLEDGFASSKEGDTVAFNTIKDYWTYNCEHTTLQLQVLQNEEVDEGVNNDGRRICYQKLALDFIITCEGAGQTGTLIGTLTGKLRSNSNID